VGCDHATKIAAETALRQRPDLSVVPGLLDLSYTENRSIAFSALERLSLHPPSWALVSLALVTTAAVLVLWTRQRRAGWAVHSGFALIVAGALGNAIDRAAHGYVVDFIYLHRWPVFNLADILVVAGVALLATRRELRRALPQA
jgi:signal peptidase II